MNLIKYILLLFFDYLILLRNLKKDKNFIIIFPRFLSLLFGFVLLFDKKIRIFFVSLFEINMTLSLFMKFSEKKVII